MDEKSLTRIKIAGFKSIRSLDLELRPLNVLIGANGAGKSNLIGFFRMLQAALYPSVSLKDFVGRSGGASRLLHDGPAVTREIVCQTYVSGGASVVRLRLKYAAGDSFFATVSGWGPDTTPNKTLDSGQDSGIDDTADVLGRPLFKFIIYHFHDTSETARIKTKWSVTDNHALKADGGNLAPVLLRLRESKPNYYRRIVETARQLLPFFADFVLIPDNGTLYLQWTELGSDLVFGADQASDGMLRILALITLLQLPTEELPSLVILDEPELGLHPRALNIVAGLIKALSLRRQVLLATQSAALLDQFEPEDVIVVERAGRESVYRRLNRDDLTEWLDAYSLGQLWNKNVLGGRP